MLALNRLGFICMAILLLAMNLVLSFCAFCFAVLVVWRFVGGLGADGTLVIPESLAIGTVAADLGGLSVFVWKNYHSVKNDLMLAL